MCEYVLGLLVTRGESGAADGAHEEVHMNYPMRHATGVTFIKSISD